MRKNRMKSASRQPMSCSKANLVSCLDCNRSLSVSDYVRGNFVSYESEFMRDTREFDLQSK